MKKLIKKILMTPIIIAIVLLLLEGSLVKKNYAIEDWEVDLSFPTENVMSQWTPVSKYNDNGTQMYPGQWSYMNIDGEYYVRNAENTDNMTGFYNPFTNYSDIDVTINMGVQREEVADDDYMGIMIRMSENIVQGKKVSSCYFFMLPGDPYSPTGWRDVPTNKFFAALNPTFGDTDQGMGKNNSGQYIQSIDGSGAGLYKITDKPFDYDSIELLQLANDRNMTWTHGVDQDVEIKATGNKIEVWVTQEGGTRRKEIEYIDTNNPIASGSYGFFACSQSGDSYNNIRGTATLARYTVTFDGNGGTPVGNSSITAISTKTYSGVPTNATRAGYDFAGWYTDPVGGTRTDIVNGATVNISQNTRVYAHWTPRNDTRYTVKHWKQNIYDNTSSSVTNEYNTHYDSNHYTLANTDVLQGTTASSVTPNVNTYEGFTSPARQTITINADGSSVLNYYYKRNVYNVSLTAGNGIQSVTGGRNYLYGASAQIKATMKPGYNWYKWEGSLINGSSSTCTFTMPAKNVSETAYGTPITYSLTYLSNDPDPTTSKAVMPTNPTTYNIETETFTLNNPTRVGYDFIGWTTDGVTTPITTMSINKGSIGNKTFTANWRARNDTHYKVQHWKQKIYDNRDEAVTEYCNTHYDEVCYFLAETDELEGTSDTTVTPNIKNYLGFTSPDRQEVLIDANGTAVLNYYYTRNEYNVELIAGYGIKETIGGRRYLFDDRVEITAVVKPGYEWEKWIGDQVTGRNITYEFLMPANDVRELASANIVNYQIEYVANDEDPTTSKAVMAINPEGYNAEADDFTIANPTRDGFNFTGWTVENDEAPEEETQPDNENEVENQDVENIGDNDQVFVVRTPTMEVTVPKGTYGNLSFIANWESKDDIKYTVQHWQQRIYKNDDEANERANPSIYNEENYKLSETDKFVGTTDTTVVPEVKVYEGFTSPAKKELLIKGDGTAVMNYYYTRHYYKLTIDKDEYTANTEGEGIYQYGEKVKVNCKSIYGYSFKEWQGDEENLKQEDYITMSGDKQIKAISQKNRHKVTVDLGDIEKETTVEYDDTIQLDTPQRDGYEFLYFETDEGKKIYDNKLHIEDKDYYVKAIYSKLPTISLPQTGDDNHGRLIALYAIIVLMAFGTVEFFLSIRKK